MSSIPTVVVRAFPGRSAAGCELGDYHVEFTRPGVHVDYGLGVFTERLASDFGHMYALSQTLTVPIPEPSPLLMMMALSALIAVRR